MYHLADEQYDRWGPKFRDVVSPYRHDHHYHPIKIKTRQPVVSCMTTGHFSFNIMTRTALNTCWVPRKPCVEDGEGLNGRLSVILGLYSGRSRFDPRQRRKDFTSNLCVQTGSGAHPASCTKGTGGPFPGSKTRPEGDADHSPHLVPRLKMSRSYSFSPPKRLVACSGTVFYFRWGIQQPVTLGVEAAFSRGVIRDVSVVRSSVLSHFTF
jgi:hypothetical protein